jgi:hypothetical protein
VRVGIVAAVLLVVVNIAIWGGRSQVNGPAAVQRPSAIIALSPDEQQLILPQDRIGAQVRPIYTGQLLIDGRVIPKDQITGDPNLGEIYFEPGAGKELTELEEGTHTAIIQWWPREIVSPEEASEQGKLASYQWTFKAG